MQGISTSVRSLSRKESSSWYRRSSCFWRSIRFAKNFLNIPTSDSSGFYRIIANSDAVWHLFSMRLLFSALTYHWGRRSQACSNVSHSSSFNAQYFNTSPLNITSIDCSFSPFFTRHMRPMVLNTVMIESKSSSHDPEKLDWPMYALICTVIPGLLNLSPCLF